MRALICRQRINYAKKPTIVSEGRGVGVGGKSSGGNILGGQVDERGREWSDMTHTRMEAKQQ